MADIRLLPGPASSRWEWQLSAACRGMDVESFFHPDGERGPARAARERAAKTVCAGCPVRRACAEHALRAREPFGVWGGLSEADRQEILAGRRTLEVAVAS